MVRIAGDLQVTGVVDSVSITETSLRIEDRFVQLAQPAAGADPVPDDQLSASGIVVGGSAPPLVPAGSAPVYSREASEKSLTWNYAGGGTELAMENYWEVRGGSLRVTKTFTGNGYEVSYGFRIAPVGGELELYQVMRPPPAAAAAGSNTLHRVVGRFGERGR